MSQGDFIAAIRQIAAERKIDMDPIVEAIKEAVLASFRLEYGFEDKDKLKVDVDTEEGDIKVFAEKTIVKKVDNNKSEVAIDTLKAKNFKLGDVVYIDITPKGDFGRIAAQSARQIILQRLREAEKDAVIKQISGRVGQIVNVVVQKITGEGDVICEINRAKAIMRKVDRIQTEFYRIGSTIKVLLKEIIEDDQGNKSIFVSRSSPEFLKQLFVLEVPEIESGTVEIVAIARDAGSRSKVAVRSLSDGVDPIGSCVGQKGVRINAISNELKSGNIEEKVDIILWDESIERFLMNAVRPAESLRVELKDKKKKEAIIIVPDQQKSLAIGRDGQNARLASELTGWNIDIVSDMEVDSRIEENLEVEIESEKKEVKKEKKVTKTKKAAEPKKSKKKSE